jgi:hypothetical protein
LGSGHNACDSCRAGGAAAVDPGGFARPVGPRCFCFSLSTCGFDLSHGELVA